MAELGDARDLKSVMSIKTGSSPVSGTNYTAEEKSAARRHYNPEVVVQIHSAQPRENPCTARVFLGFN